MVKKKHPARYVEFSTIPSPRVSASRWSMEHGPQCNFLYSSVQLLQFPPPQPQAQRRLLSPLCKMGKLPGHKPWVFPSFPGWWYRFHARALPPFLLTLKTRVLILKQQCSNTMNVALTTALVFRNARPGMQTLVLKWFFGVLGQFTSA